jgi:hypothetical protein
MSDSTDETPQTPDITPTVAPPRSGSNTRTVLEIVGAAVAVVLITLAAAGGFVAGLVAGEFEDEGRGGWRMAEEYDGPGMAEEYDGRGMAEEYDGRGMAEEYDGRGMAEEYGGRGHHGQGHHEGGRGGHGSPGMDGWPGDPMPPDMAPEMAPEMAPSQQG